MVRVHLLGGLEVEGVPALGLGSRKGRAVLRRLAAAEGSVVSEEVLLDIAWPDGHPVRPRDQLAVLVSRLRSALGTDAIVRQDAGYRLATTWLDLDEVRSAARELPATEAGLRAGQQALRLVRGPLLPEEDQPWVEEQRTALQELVQQLRRATATAALAAGRPGEAVELARACLLEDAYDEHALRLLMEASLAGGQVPAALRAYEEAAGRLADELGVDPSPETRALHLRLLQRTAEPVAVPAVGGRDGLVASLLRSPVPSLQLVTGAPGMGKTTLVDALASSAESVVRVRGHATGLGVPLQPVLDALSGVPLTGPGALLAPLLQPGATGSAAATALEVSHDRAALAAAVAHVLTELAAGGRVLVLVDDGQLLDEASAALLRHIARAASQVPVLVVVAARPGTGPDWTAATRHELEPLGLAEVTAVVGPGRAAEVLALSNGHPLFVSELARSEGPLADDVLVAIGQRFDRSPALTEVLRTAAVLAEQVDVDLLATVLQRPVPEVLDQLDEAVAQQLLRTTVDGFAFVHDLHRQALTHAVSPARAALLHRLAARALADRPRQDPVRIGHHALAGGDDELAAMALTAAAELATARYEHVEALAMLDRAVPLAPTPERRLRRAQALLMLGRYDEADAEATSAGSGPDALEVRALVAYLSRDLDNALHLAHTAAAAATDPEQAAGCLVLAARILLATGQLEASESAFREALALSTGRVRGIAGVWLALALATRDEATEALLVLRSPAVAQVRSLPLVEPHRGLAHGRALAMTGRAAEAVAVFDQLAATVAEQQVRRFAGRAENFRGWVLRNVGAVDAAKASNEMAWDAVQALDAVTGAEARGHAVLDLADHALRTGSLTEAEHWVDLAREAELAPHVMRWRFDLRRDLLAGRLALAHGDADAAEERAEAARAGAAAVGVRRFTVQADLLTARARAHRGEPAGPLPSPAEVARFAALESWWLMAELARDLGDDRWRAAAAQRVDALLPGAGAWAEDLRAAARQLL